MDGTPPDAVVPTRRHASECAALCSQNALPRRAGLGLVAWNEAGVTVTVDGVGVSGTSECACLSPNRCALAGTAVCVKSVEAEELKGIGEDRREGVGVTAEEGSVWVLMGGWKRSLVGQAHTPDGDGGSASCFWTSNARYC